MGSDDVRRLSRRFLILRLVGVGQSMSGILALFLLFGTGLSLSTLLSAIVAILLTIVSVVFLRR